MLSQIAWKYVEDLVEESPVVAKARRDSREFGVDPVSPATGAQLGQLAAAAGAKQIFEIGTGLGVSGLWLLSGAPEATLTSVDIEPEFQSAARDAFAAAGVATARTRLMQGRALDLLPRIDDGAYDLVLVDADPRGVIDYVEHALRITRPGGTVAVARALHSGRVADPANRDEVTIAFRDLVTVVAGSDAVVSALSPVARRAAAAHAQGVGATRREPGGLLRDGLAEAVDEFLRLGVVDREHHASAALDRDADDDEAAFLLGLHRSVSTARLLCGHGATPFDERPPIIAYRQDSP